MVSEQKSGDDTIAGAVFGLLFDANLHDVTDSARNLRQVEANEGHNASDPYGAERVELEASVSAMGYAYERRNFKPGTFLSDPEVTKNIRPILRQARPCINMYRLTLS